MLPYGSGVTQLSEAGKTCKESRAEEILSLTLLKSSDCMQLEIEIKIGVGTAQELLVAAVLGNVPQELSKSSWVITAPEPLRKGRGRHGEEHCMEPFVRCNIEASRYQKREESLHVFKVPEFCQLVATGWGPWRRQCSVLANSVVCFFFLSPQVLLMGKSGSGKTSMRSIIFANYIARDTRRLGATIDVEHSHVRFLGNLVLNLWDCGGQDTFMENYFTSQRDNIFRNVEVLIYVFDVESRELEKDMHYYQSCLEAILQNSPDAKIFCLVHKMDLVQEDQRDLIFKEREEDLRRLSRPLECACFRTSIWDETLYKAWSSIVYQLIPNVQQLEMNLRNFAQIIEADEVLLFERATFLVISHYQCKEQRDIHRFEKISNIIKQFKLSCSKLAASFQSMEVRNSNFAAFIDIFTSNTYVMVVMSDPSIPSAATLINIRNARKHFEKLERVDGPKHSLLMR
ncbi:hypothetical protein ASZ78_016852 [Callipepla squamata]|nr:hypothetical protein ASZ78_016852 [Callipepla squamata]